MLLLLGSPLHSVVSGRFLVLRWVGRRSGDAHATPVSYIEEDGRLLLTSHETWSANFERAAPVAVTLRGRLLTGTAERVSDEQEAVAGHERMFRRRWSFAWLAGFRPRPGRRPSREEIEEAIRGGRVLVRVVLDADGGDGSGRGARGDGEAA